MPSFGKTPMKKTILLFLFALFTASLFTTSCQRDDICSEPTTTPNLIIRFYDATDATETKSVINLRVFELGGDEIEVVPSGTTDSIAIPLRSLQDFTEFVFVSNSSIDEIGNETGDVDTLRIGYTVNERFLSRGCGVVANYELPANGLLIEDDERWIISTEIITSTIIDETAAHVQIFH